MASGRQLAPKILQPKKRRCGFHQLTTSPQALQFFEPNYTYLLTKFPGQPPNETYASQIPRCGRLSTRSVRNIQYIYMYVCIYICIHICMYIYIYVYSMYMFIYLYYICYAYVYVVYLYNFNIVLCGFCFLMVLKCHMS